MSQVMALFAAIGVVSVIALIIWVAAASTTDLPGLYYEDKDDADY